ncbi:RNB domain-containing protein, partial [Helicosporidium sp. ATCC 50920]
RLLVSLRALARLRKCSVWVDDLHHAGLAAAAEESQLAALEERDATPGSRQCPVRCSERYSAPLRRLLRVGAWLRSEAGAEAVVVVSEEAETGDARGENETDGKMAPMSPPPPQPHSPATPPDDVAALLASLDAGASKTNDIEDLLDQLDLGGSTPLPANDDFGIESLLAELDVEGSGAAASAAASGRPDAAISTSLLSPGAALERYFGSSAAVMEALAARRTDGAPARGPLAAAYASHFSPAALEAGLERGSLFRGPASVWRSVGGEWLGTVKVCMGDDEHVEVGIAGRERLNRALHGDTVVVQLLPARGEGPGDGRGVLEAESGPAAELLGVGLVGGDADGVGEGTSSSQTASSASPSSTKLQGRVVGVLRRATEVFAACLTAEQESALEGASESLAMRTLRCIPSNRRLPLFALSTRRAGTLVGARFALRFADWDASSELPVAVLAKVLGPRLDLETETRALLLECGLGSDGAGDVAESLDAAKEAEAELALLAEQVDEDAKTSEESASGGRRTPIPQTIPAPSSIRLSPEDLAQRRDLRDSTLIFSVDPPGCTDVDDAMSLREVRDASGALLLEVGVHIADVCAWVREGGSLDRAAAQKGTTIYLPGRRLDMFPGLLSEDVCSLRQGRTRRAVSVLWRLHPHDLRVKELWMGRTLLRSAAQLEYGHAQEMLDDPRGGADRVKAALSDAGSESPAPTLAQLRGASAALGTLKRLADARRAARLER